MSGKLEVFAGVAATLVVAAAPLAGSSGTPEWPGRSLDAFGAAVAVTENEVLIGEPQNATEPGYVFIYRKTNGQWREHARLRASDGEPGDGFGAGIVIEGNRMVVAAFRQPHGNAYVFERGADGSWQETAKLGLENPTGMTVFGMSVALRGDEILVGAPATDQAGVVHLYHRGTDGTWAHSGEIRSTSAAGEGLFGTVIQVSGDDALIATSAGGIVAFRNVNGTWTEAGKLPVPGRATNTFRRPLALHDGQAFVTEAAGNNGTGAVHVFTHGQDGAWALAGTVTPPDSTQAFGASIALDGNMLWIGAPNGDRGRGVVYLFERTGSTWTALPAIRPADLPADARFGGTAAVRNGVAAVGLVGADFGAGKAMIVERSGTQVAVAATVFSELRGLDPVTGGAVNCDDGKTGTFACGGTVELVSFLPIGDISSGRGVRLNDIWGWTDPTNNKEYALVGRNDGTAFVDITDPANPVYVGQLLRTEGSPASSWRDIKVYMDHAYIVSDNAREHGMQVVDLAKLRQYSGSPITFSPDTTYHYIASAHNIVINESTGFAYPVGASGGGETCGGGLHMIDIRDPKNPKFAGCFADPQTGSAGTGYSHDAQCVMYHGPDPQYQAREICIGSNETAISIADVTDKENPKAISRASYPNVQYTHQGWFTDDHRFFYVNDEGDEISGVVPRTRTLVWDLTDLDDPVLVKEHLGEAEASDHNLYVKGNLMYQANYASGLRILDISDPANPREVGFLDTNPFGDNSAGFNGAWSNYPFFQSGVIAVSSIEQGLFLVRYRPVRPIS
jgi:choice-of-anchor B domain-containing protein